MADMSRQQVKRRNSNDDVPEKQRRRVYAFEENVVKQKPYNGCLLTLEEAAEYMPEDVKVMAMEYYLSRISSHNKPRDPCKDAAPICRDRFLTYKKDFNRKLSIDKLKWGEVLGAGSFGRVWRAEYKGKLVAVKEIGRNSYAEEIIKERDIMVKLKHARIMRLLAAFHDSSPFLMMELHKCSLRDIVKFKKKNQVRYFTQLLQGIEWLHENGVLHCDLKTENCMITFNNNLVIGDFGASLVLDRNLKETAEFVHAYSIIGNACFSDYEVLCRFYYSKANDIFGAACILYEMVMQEPLMLYLNAPEGINTITLYREVFEKGRLQEDTGRGVGTRIFLKDRVKSATPFEKILGKMVQRSSKARPTATQLLRSPELEEVMSRAGVNLENLDSCGEDDVFVHPEKTKKKPPVKKRELYVEDGISVGYLYRDAVFKTPEHARFQTSPQNNTTMSRGTQVSPVPGTSRNVDDSNGLVSNLTEPGLMTTASNETVSIVARKAKVVEKITSWLLDQPLVERLDKELENEGSYKWIETEREIFKKLENALKTEDIEETPKCANEAFLLAPSPVHLEDEPLSQPPVEEKKQDKSSTDVRFDKEKVSKKVLEACVEARIISPLVCPSPTIIRKKRPTTIQNRFKRCQKRTRSYPLLVTQTKGQKEFDRAQIQEHVQEAGNTKEDAFGATTSKCSVDYLFEKEKFSKKLSKASVETTHANALQTPDIIATKKSMEVLNKETKSQEEVQPYPSCAPNPKTLHTEYAMDEEEMSKTWTEIRHQVDSQRREDVERDTVMIDKPRKFDKTLENVEKKKEDLRIEAKPVDTLSKCTEVRLECDENVGQSSPMKTKIEGKFPCMKCKQCFTTVTDVQNHMIKCYKWL